MTSDEYIAELQLFSDAFQGNSNAQMQAIVRRTLNDYSQHRPRYLVSSDNVVTQDGVYDLEDEALGVVAVVDSYRKLEINFRLNDPEMGAKQLVLGRLKRPSWDDLVEVDYYRDPYNRTSYGYSDYYDSFDYVWYRLKTIEEVEHRNLNILMLYSEYLGYRDKASQTQYHSQLTDTDPSGAGTTSRQSNSAREFMNLAKQSKAEYDDKVLTNYMTRDSTVPGTHRRGSYNQSDYLYLFNRG